VSILGSLIGPVTDLVGKFVEDKDQRNALAHDISTLASKQATELAKGQLAVNAVEAAHKSLFVAGWRPFSGWICGLALGYSTLAAPILSIWFTVPPVDNTLLTTVLLGMLGMGSIRSVEKYTKVSREK